jgi:3-oxoacyl-[acyl-carrier protein] reductase
VFDLDGAGLEALRAEHEGVRTLVCDVSEPNAVAAALAQFHEENRAADVLVNNAGILYSEPLVRIGAGGIVRHDVAMWNKVLAADLSSVFYMTSHVVERMVATRTKGVIVNVSSVSAGGNAGQSAYSAAKAGVNALTATWAKELSLMGIRVCAVAPGFTETESTRDAVSDAVLQETVKRVPLRRLGKPSEIADGIMAVIQNDFFTGKVFELDGGLRI